MQDGEHLGRGTLIAGYRVLEKLYEGGMAVIYRVAAGDGKQDGLLKIPKLGFGSHPACSAGFDAEQMILGRIASPHVPRLLASGEEDFGPYLVIERISGHVADADRLGDSACRFSRRHDVFYHDC